MIWTPLCPLKTPRSLYNDLNTPLWFLKAPRGLYNEFNTIVVHECTKRSALCSLLFLYPFQAKHMKDPGHSAKSAGGRQQLNTHAPYVCGLCDVIIIVHVYMAYTERAEVAAVSSGASRVRTKQRCIYTTWVDDQSPLWKATTTQLESRATRVQCVCLRAENTAI